MRLAGRKKQTINGYSLAHMSYNLSWHDIRVYLKGQFPDIELKIVEEKYQSKSFGNGYIVYEIDQKLICLNFDNHDEQIFLLESVDRKFNFHSCVLLETFCLWEYPNKSTALENVRQNLRSLSSIINIYPS